MSREKNSFEVSRFEENQSKSFRISKFIGIFICISCFFLGVIVTIIIIHFDFFMITMKKVNWSVLEFWLLLFVGALLPIVFNYISVRKQEVIKLKAKVAEEKIDIIRKFNEFEVSFRYIKIIDKKVEDLNLDFHPIFNNSNLSGSHVLSSKEEYKKFRQSLTENVEKLRGLGCNNIEDHALFINRYIFNLDKLLNNKSEEFYFIVSIIIKDDFLDISRDSRKIINKYLNEKLYTFKNDNYDFISERVKEILQELEKTKLFEYKDKLNASKVTIIKDENENELIRIE